MKSETGTTRYAFSDLQDILEVGNQMSNIRRYSRDFMVKEENVLEHVGFVVYFCAVVAKRLIAEGVDVDIAKLLLRAVMHDIGETITGDVARPTKYSRKSVKNGLDAFEGKAVKHIEKVLSISFTEEWENAKDESIEGYIIRIADWASVLVKVMTEVVYYNNHGFIRVLEELAQGREEFLEIGNKHAPLSYFTVALVQLLNTISDHVEDPVRNRMEINQWLAFFEVI